MITREDIKIFYDEYKKNLAEEGKLSESVFDIESIGDLEMKLIKRKHDIGLLYSHNQQLLKKYIYPLINKEEAMTKELADEIIEQAYLYVASGYIDEYGGLVLLKLVEEYYNNNEDMDKELKLYLLLGVCYKYKDDERIKSIDYYKKQTECIDYYFESKNWETQRILLLSLFNYSAQLVAISGNYLTYGKEELQEHIELVIKNTKFAIDFYNREDVRAIAGDRFDFEQITEELIINAYGELIINCYFIQAFDKSIFEPTICGIEHLYENKIAQNCDVNELPPSLCCAYIISQYMSNKYTQSEFIGKYFEYCRSVLDKDEQEETIVNIHSRFVYVCLHSFVVLYRLMRFEKISDDKTDEIVSYHIEKYLHMMEILPRHKSVSFVNQMLLNGVRDIVNTLPTHMSKFQFIMKILIKNDENLMISSVMVRNISSLILGYVYEQAPELLIGLFDTTNVREVFDKQEEINSYVKKASLVYDIGKIGVADIIQKQTRMLNPGELGRIQLHVESFFDTKVVQVIDKDFIDIIKGHHKYYDGSKGYPLDFDNTKSKYRFIIDLIKICDDLNASTDYYSRSYKNPISFEQFLKELGDGAGTRYNPDLVKLIMHNKELQKDLKECCITNRIKYYYDTYYEFINKSNHFNTHENVALLPAWTKNALRVLEIDFLNDTVKTRFVNNMSFNSNIEDTAFSAFPYYLYMHMVHPDDEERIKKLFDYGYLSEKISDNNGTYEIEIRVRKNENEEYRWLKFQFLSFAECYGIAQIIHVIIWDVEEQHKKNNKMQEALNKTKQEELIADRTKKIFISNISHQIRTPMNTIVGMARMLSHADLSNDDQQYLKNLVKSSNELIHIVYDMIDFTKIQSGNLEFEEADYNIFDILNEISLSTLNKLGEKPVELIYNIDPRIPETLCGDALRIKQIIKTFIRNSIRYTDQGSILLGMKIKNIVSDEIEFIINIKDTGNGITPEVLEHIFDSVNSSQDSNAIVKTGLELVVAKKLIEMMGGSISVKSTCGVGTEFFITISQKIGKNTGCCEIKKDIIPKGFTVGYLFDERMLNGTVEELCKFYGIDFVNLYTQDRRVDFIFTDCENLLEVNARFRENVKICVLYNPLIEKKRINKVCYIRKPLYADNFVRTINNYTEGIVTKNDEAGYTAPKSRILVVDDTPIHLTVVKGLLEPLKMSIDTAESGMEAIEKIKNNYYNIVFMDYKMPIMDGVEAVRMIRAIDGDYYKKVPIIALTAIDSKDVRNDFYNAGIDDIISKPINFEELIQKVKKWLPNECIVE